MTSLKKLQSFFLTLVVYAEFLAASRNENSKKEKHFAFLNKDAFRQPL